MRSICYRDKIIVPGGSTKNQLLKFVEVLYPGERANFARKTGHTLYTILQKRRKELLTK